MRIIALPVVIFTLFSHTPAMADENLLGYVKGAETLPEGSAEFYQFITQRKDKSYGSYSAWNTVSEFEYGVTNRFTASAALLG